MIKTIIIMLAIASCAHDQTSRRSADTTETWRLVAAACERVDPEQVTCQMAGLKAAMAVSAQAEHDRDQCFIELEKCTGLAAINCQLLSGKVAACEARESSPWRSPWLWGIVGAGLGFGLGAAVAR